MFKIPEAVESGSRVQAWFTLKNPGAGLPGEDIGGLNLGFNTGEREEIIEGNRKRLERALGLEPGRMAVGEQVHGNRIEVVSGGGLYPGTDALVTRVRGLALGVLVADCAAVLLWDDENRTAAAVHAGWRGAAADIIAGTIEKMTGLGAETEKMRAYISPCISQRNFEVGPEVAERFPGDYVDYSSYEKPHLDLKGFLRSRMLGSGMVRRNIETDGDCTIEKEDLYYSYRREGRRSGRMMGVIKLNA